MYRVWRISTTIFAHPTHPEPDWALLRKQLSTANVSRDTGEVPVLVLLADEIAGMARFQRETGHLPFGGRSGTESYRSLTADLDASLVRLGPRLRAVASALLYEACDSRWSPPCRGAEPPWAALFEAGNAEHVVGRFGFADRRPRRCG